MFQKLIRSILVLLICALLHQRYCKGEDLRSLKSTKLCSCLWSETRKLGQLVKRRKCPLWSPVALSRGVPAPAQPPSQWPGLYFFFALLDFLRGKLHTNFLCYKFSLSSHLLTSFLPTYTTTYSPPFLKKAHGPPWLFSVFNTLVEVPYFSLMCPSVSKKLCFGYLFCMVHFCLPSSAIAFFLFYPRSFLNCFLSQLLPFLVIKLLPPDKIKDVCVPI